MVEVEQVVASERVVDQEPFLIRAHHLIFYLRLVMGANPSHLAEITAFRIAEGLLDELLLKNINSKATKYGEDVLGTGSQVYRFVESSKLTFKTFLQLPDNHPATIVEGIPDAICDGCAIGKHCRKLFNNDYHDGESTFIKDREYINLFLKNLDELGLPKPTIIQEQASFSDAVPQQVRTIRTTIGTVKQVLKERTSMFW